jgi:hypothetical protein
MKILNEETILVKEVPPGHAHYAQLEANVATLATLTNCYGRPYRIVRVYCGSLGGSHVAAYTNSMILNHKVFVPLYGISTDSAAIAAYEAAMPGYEVLGYTGSWLSDDAIHCRTMEIHDREMLVVDTDPLQDLETNAGPYTVRAYIDDRSDAGLAAESLLVYWRLAGSQDFAAVPLQATAHPDSFDASIPAQADSSTVDYYVFAKDLSGRGSTRPPIAPRAWYSFETGAADLAGTGDPDAPRRAPDACLVRCWPNPLRYITNIEYDLPQTCRVTVTIHDVSGRHVATLVDGAQEAGLNMATWDGRGRGGSRLKPGIYFCTLRACGRVESRKVVLLE